VTPVLGETENGEKTTRRSPDILPETVIYDVDLTLDLPVPTTVTSAINALAHAVEALYSPEANAMVDAVAVQAIRGIAHSLPLVVASPSDVDARAELLESAWLAGSCLTSVSMGLHHKLCHELGGRFDLPHAETHTVVLPYVLAFNAPAGMVALRRALGADDPVTALRDMVSTLGGPVSLAAIGMRESDVDAVAETVAGTPVPNPRPVTREAVAHLLRRAWAGRNPLDEN
jgi:maleylacetate reductase